MLSVLVAPLAMSGTAEAACAVTTNGPRDPEANSIIWGGAYSKSEWVCKVHNGDGHNSAANIQQIYFNEGRGITEANFNNTVDGYVTKTGNVYAGGKLVATGAKSIGRDYMTGSVKSGSVWMRSTSVSFAASQIDAFVNMDGGTFHYFILKSCGNAGVATPVPTPTPKPTPSATPEQSFMCVSLTPSQLELTDEDKKDHTVSFRFEVEKSIKNVTFTGYRFTLIQLDDKGETVSTKTTDVNDTTKTYADFPFTEGSWKVQAQVKTSAGITATNEACSTEIIVTKSTPSPSPSVSPSATPTPSPTGQVLHASLPDTGAESLVLGGAAGLTAIGYAGRAYLRSRKSLIEALRKKK